MQIIKEIDVICENMRSGYVDKNMNKIGMCGRARCEQLNAPTWKKGEMKEKIL